VRRALLLALALGACSQGQPTNNVTPQQSQAASGYALRSNVEGASLVRLAELPKVTSLPRDSNPNGFCEERYIEPKTAAGKLAERRGWRVRQEKRFHQFEAVVIVRGLTPLFGDRCQAVDPNIAFFEGDRLIGILYPKGKDGIRIDSLELVNNHLRIWSEDPVAEGQVDLDGANLHFDAITGSDLVCNGKDRVPAMFGDTYPQARAALIAAGWSPVPSEEELRGEVYTEARKRFPELDYCLDTGYGECGFTFVAKDGVTLSIETLSGIDDPTFSSYSACDDKPDQDP
jgi:hypothetical protein